MPLFVVALSDPSVLTRPPCSQEGGVEKHFIHNHARFTILYHKDVETDLARIVGFEVEPASVKHSWKEWNVNDPKLDTCNAEKHPMENPSG